MPVLILIDVFAFVGLTAGAIGGSIGGWCQAHPGPGCAKRSTIDLSDVPKVNFERQEVGPCNIPKYNFDLCHDQLQAQTIQVVSSIPSPGVARFDNIPPACMNLASVLGGSCTGEGARPTPCGSACMQYTGLTDTDMANLSRALNA
ncbi:hypothetical protein V495_01064 [Pseudogymnoascus sp. VKM F-4514 (FW-929)]|nr:hypothetical protein V495_01064 [Pseudogymnoascus sp. VKM F-4514 (FW-929)]KFY58140.1 hypothetical protein V497_05072 [Pseudogymnoascus sp. VKM F-4516 (FW-969)]